MWKTRKKWNKIQKEYLRRIRKLLETKLNCRNLIKGINTWAVPLVRYSGPILKWTRDELKQMDQRTRKLIAMHKALHPRDNVDRLYVSRKEGGRRLASIEDSVVTSIQQLEDYIQKHDGGLITATRNDTENTMNNRMTITRKQKWEGKQLYGWFKWLINISHDKTWTWLRKGNFKRETESLLIAAQDNAVRTNHIKARIDKTQQNCKCRLCGDRDETINHIISESSKLAQREYKARHDWVGKMIHWEICKKFKFDDTNKWYMHNPAPVLENDTHKLLWDFNVQTDHLIPARRRDFITVNKKKRTCKIVDFAVPADHRIKLKECEKKDKYLDLARELKKLWNMQVTIIPIVIGAFGTVTKGLLKGLEDLEVGGRVETIQTTALLRTARILRRVLETWGDLLSLRLRIVDFAAPADCRVKLKENEKRDKYLDLARELKKPMEHESDGDTICNWCTRRSHQRIDTGTGGLRNKRMNRDHPNYSIIKISQNTEKSPGNSKKLAVTQTPVRNHLLTQVGKLLKE